MGGRSGLIYMVSFVLNSSVLLMSSTAGGSMVRDQKLFLCLSVCLCVCVGGGGGMEGCGGIR